MVSGLRRVDLQGRSAQLVATGARGVKRMKDFVIYNDGDTAVVYSQLFGENIRVDRELGDNCSREEFFAAFPVGKETKYEIEQCPCEGSA